MIYLILMIVIITFILYLIYKDYLEVLKITSIITISSGILTFIVGYLIKHLININITFINITSATNVIMYKFAGKGIILLIIGLLEFICYFIIDYNIGRKRKLSNS